MEQGTGVGRESIDRRWRRISIALLLGFITFNFMAAHVTIHQPAIGPTIAALPLFNVTLVVAVISVPLLWWETSGSHSMTMLAALLGLLSLGLVASGTLGRVKPGTPPIDPVVYLLIAVALIITTYRARNE